jgi:hypothetical protein
MFKHLINGEPKKKIHTECTAATVRIITNSDLNYIYKEGKVSGLILKKSTFEKYMKLSNFIFIEIVNGEHGGSMITGIIPSMDYIKSSGLVDRQNRKLKYIKFVDANFQRYKYMIVKDGGIPPKEDKQCRKPISWKIKY